MSEYKGRQLEGANFHIFPPANPQPSRHGAEDKACAASDPRLATAPRARSSPRRNGSPSPRAGGSPTLISTKSPSRGSRRRPPRVPLGRCPIAARPGTPGGKTAPADPRGVHNDQSWLAASDPGRPGGSRRPHVAWPVLLRFRMDCSPLLRPSPARTCQKPALLNG